jgi:hypothetical protein
VKNSCPAILSINLTIFYTGNEVIIRQMKSIQAKQAAAKQSVEPKKPRKQLDESQLKEVNASKTVVNSVALLTKISSLCAMP